MDQLPRSGSFLESIKRLTEIGKAEFEPSSAAPVFLHAVGWGSGSTLLQRILMTDDRLLLWGEPYGKMGIISSIVKGFDAVGDSWPKERWFNPDPELPAWERGLANYYPDPAALLAGLKSMIESWLEKPAIKSGYERWGLKEVRFGAAEAQLLRILFPKSKFVVLVRDPRHGFQSQRGTVRSRKKVLGFRIERRIGAYWRFDLDVKRAGDYARFWDTLVREWLDGAAGLDHRIIRYEDLVSGTVDFRSLEQWLDLEIDEKKALGHVTHKKAGGGKIGPIDRWTLERIAGQSMRRLGYGT